MAYVKELCFVMQNGVQECILSLYLYMCFGHPHFIYT